MQQGVGDSGVGGQAGLMRLWLLGAMAVATGALAQRSAEAPLKLGLTAAAVTLGLISIG